jgi:hypothetical protein
VNRTGPKRPPRLKRDDGGPAHRMSLRDYFAAAALPSVARHPISAECEAKLAYELADEMLKARRAPRVND